MALECGDNGSTGQQVLAQINTNTVDIATNVANIIINEDNITDLEGLHNYNAISEVDILTVGDVYEEMVNLTATVTPGKYMLTWSTTYTFDVTNKSVYTQITVNGVTEEFRAEPKDNTDRRPVSYTYPIHIGGGSFIASLEMRKEDVTGILNVQFASFMLDKKSEL